MEIFKKSAYREAGVDIDLASQLLENLKPKFKTASRPEMLAPVGGFGGLFQLDLSRYREPVLVSSIDGVGTKLIVATRAGQYRSVGYDIVNHCVNDVIVQGAEPLFFLDYIGIGKLRNPLYEEVLSGIVEACRAQNVALLGGETAEMPGIYQDEFDLVGCLTGVVEKKKIITGETIRPGDIGVGLASNGLHTNGYSLARKVLFEQVGYDIHQRLPELDGETVANALLRPHVCYWPVIQPLLQEDRMILKGIAHITGGGFYDNIPRILPNNVDVICDPDVLSVPPIFKLIQEKGGINDREMYRVFNMGVGMILFVEPQDVDRVCKTAFTAGIPAAPMAKVVHGSQVVKVKGIDI